MCPRVFNFISALQKVDIQKVDWMIRNTMSKVHDCTMEKIDDAKWMLGRHAMLLITFSLLSPNMKECKFDEH
jgi:hypothetical protein